MRFFELIVEQEPVQKVSTDSPVAPTKDQHPNDKEPVVPIKKSRLSADNFYFDAEGNTLPADQAQNASFIFASKNELDGFSKKIDTMIKQKSSEAKAENKSTRPPHIRVLYIPFEEVKDDIESILGVKLQSVNSGQLLGIYNERLTGKGSFIKQTATINNTIYPFVFNQSSGIVGQEKNNTPILIADKQLTPDKFFAQPAEFANSDALAEATKAKLAGFKDEKLKSALIQLVDVANGKIEKVDPDLISYISANSTSFNNISKDFGEILTPIMIGRLENQAISFPSKSNEALADAFVGGKPVAVKSLSGSGNGMTSIMDMIEAYEEQMSGETNEKRNQLYQFLKGQKTERGKRISLDNMIQGAFDLPTKEAGEIQNLIGAGPFTSYAEFSSAVKNWIKVFDKYSDPKQKYTAYLETIKPISVTSGYGKKLKDGTIKLEPIGMPSDATKYISYKDVGASDKAGKDARSGFPKFKENFEKAASLQLTYLLAISSERLLKPEGRDGETMTNLLTDIMRNKGASAAHITINKDGTLTMVKKPFSQLRFGYQYHAATDNPNRNAPGWHIIFD